MLVNAVLDAKGTEAVKFFGYNIWFKNVPSMVLIEVTDLVIYLNWALHMLRHLDDIHQPISSLQILLDKNMKDCILRAQAINKGNFCWHTHS